MSQVIPTEEQITELMSAVLPYTNLDEQEEVAKLIDENDLEGALRKSQEIYGRYWLVAAEETGVTVSDDGLLSVTGLDY